MSARTFAVRRSGVCLLLLSLLLMPTPQRAALAQQEQRCFPETGLCIEGRIREFWEQNGGLPVFGFPTTPQREEQIEGRPFQVQWFERNRLELHPENARPYDVLLGRLGPDRLAQQGRDWFAFPKGEPQPGARFFPETGHSVSGPVLAAWRASGLELDGQPGASEAESLALFGLPLSDLQAETLGDGKEYQVQWFERARFELHPENQPPYDVLLGLLGNEVRAGAPAPQPADPCAGVPAPVDAAVIPGSCVALGELLIIGAHGFAPGETYAVTLTGPGGASQPTASEVPASSHGSLLLPKYSDELSPGTWTFTFRGDASGHTATAAIRVLPGEQEPPRDGYVYALALPPKGPVGTRFDFVASGFMAGDRVGIYLTAPDQSVYGARYQDTANGLGLVLGNYFDSEVLRGEPGAVGVWAMTFEGLTLGDKSIARFEVTP